MFTNAARFGNPRIFLGPGSARAVAQFAATGENTMRLLLTIVLASTLTACVTTNTNYRPTSVDISEPAIGQVVTAEVGGTMLRQGKYTEQEAIYLPSDVRIGAFAPYTLSRGYYVREGEDAKNEFYHPEPGPEGGRIDKAALADPFKTVMLRRADNAICAVTVMNVKVCEKNVSFQRLKRPALTIDGFQQTLLYSGRIGNKINISYREFSNNMARPAFNNDVEYDLGESMVIGYKGAEIEIVEATNRMIKYRVIRNFNQAAM
jgi:hypothetical protein